MKIAAVAIALVIGSFAFGQTPEERAVRLTNKMTEELSLTLEQVEQISEINMGIAMKNESVRTSDMTEDAKNEMLGYNAQACLNMYQVVLTPDQYTEFGTLVLAADEQL